MFACHLYDSLIHLLCDAYWPCNKKHSNQTMLIHMCVYMYMVLLKHMLELAAAQWSDRLCHSSLDYVYTFTDLVLMYHNERDQFSARILWSKYSWIVTGITRYQHNKKQ